VDESRSSKKRGWGGRGRGAKREAEEVPPLPAGPVPITGLAADPRRVGAVRVSAGGRVRWTVPIEVAQAERLVVGGVVDEAVRARLDRASELEGAYRTVLRALESRAYARADLGRRLVRKGLDAAAVEAALERAEGHGLIDDAAFARHWVETRGARGRGPSRLVRDLLARGVDRRHVDAAIAEVWPDGPEIGDQVQALAERRARQLGALPTPVKRRRVLAFLARRGYMGREVSDLVARVVG